MTDDYTKDSRCEVCRLTPGLCVCDHLPRIASPVRVLIVRHAKEEWSQSNTGSLLHRVLEGSEILRYALGDGPFDDTPLRGPGTHVLYPRPGASVVTPKLAPDVKTLVLLDARWRQARRMSTRIEALHSAPFLMLPLDIEPRWVLRKPTHDGRRPREHDRSRGCGVGPVGPHGNGGRDLGRPRPRDAPPNARRLQDSSGLH